MDKNEQTLYFYKQAEKEHQENESKNSILAFKQILKHLNESLNIQNG